MSERDGAIFALADEYARQVTLNPRRIERATPGRVCYDGATPGARLLAWCSASAAGPSRPYPPAPREPLPVSVRRDQARAPEPQPRPSPALRVSDCAENPWLPLARAMAERESAVGAMPLCRSESHPAPAPAQCRLAVALVGAEMGWERHVVNGYAVWARHLLAAQALVGYLPPRARRRRENNQNEAAKARTAAQFAQARATALAQGRLCAADVRAPNGTAQLRALHAVREELGWVRTWECQRTGGPRLVIMPPEPTP
jgi:hypothetical protein